MVLNQPTTMKVIIITIALCLLFGRYSSRTKNTVGVVSAQGGDVFNYDTTDLAKSSYGPAEWGNVTCDNVATCVSSTLLCLSLIS